MSARRPSIHLVGEASRRFALDVSRVVASTFRRLGCDVLVSMRAGQEATLRARLALRTELLVVCGDVALPDGALDAVPSTRVVWLGPGEPGAEGAPDRLSGYAMVYVARAADADRARALGAAEVRVLPTVAVDGARGWSTSGRRSTPVLARTPADDRQAGLLDGLAAITGVELVSPGDPGSVGCAYGRAQVAVVVAGHDASGHDAEALTAAAAGAAVVAEPLHDPDLLVPDEHVVVVPPDDPAALVAAVRSLHLDPRRAAAMGAAARGHVLSAHTLESRLETLLSNLPGRLRVNESRGQAVLRDPSGRETRSVSSFQRAVRTRCQAALGRPAGAASVLVVGPLATGLDGRPVVSRAEVYVPDGDEAPPEGLGALRVIRPSDRDPDRVALLRRFEVEPPPTLVALERVLREGHPARVGLTGLDPANPAEAAHLERMLSAIASGHPDLHLHLRTGVGEPALPNVHRHLLLPGLELPAGLLGRLHAAGGPEPDGLALVTDLVAVDRAVRRILAVHPGPVVELLETLVDRLGVVVDVVDPERPIDGGPPATARIRFWPGPFVDAPEGGYDLVLLLAGLEPGRGRAWRGPLPLRPGGFVVARAPGREPVSVEVVAEITERPSASWVALGGTRGMSLHRLIPAGGRREAA